MHWIGRALGRALDRVYIVHHAAPISHGFNPSHMPRNGGGYNATLQRRARHCVDILDKGQAGGVPIFKGLQALPRYLIGLSFRFA